MVWHINLTFVKTNVWFLTPPLFLSVNDVISYENSQGEFLINSIKFLQSFLWSWASYGNEKLLSLRYKSLFKTGIRWEIKSVPHYKPEHAW